MNDIRDWIKRRGRRITAQEIGDILGLSRTSATRRLVSGELDANEVILICKALDLPAVTALVDLGFLTEDDVARHYEHGGLLLDTADEADLVLELARRIVPIARRDELSN